MPRIVMPSDKELSNIAQAIIDKHHPNLRILKIAYVFRDIAAISDNKARAGMCYHVDDRNWAIHKKDFIVEIAKDIWDEATPEFRMAIMDHELHHVGIRFDEDGTPMSDEMTNRFKTYCRTHDVEEFETILERYGTYHKGLRDFIRAFTKRKMDEQKEREDKAKEKKGAKATAA